LYSLVERFEVVIHFFHFFFKKTKQTDNTWWIFVINYGKPFYSI